MLVTLRREGEALMIGDDIEITIVRIGSTRVRVGIRAPQKYRVVAGEKRQMREDVPRAVPPSAIPVFQDPAEKSR